MSDVFGLEQKSKSQGGILSHLQPYTRQLARQQAVVGQKVRDGPCASSARRKPARRYAAFWTMACACTRSAKTAAQSLGSMTPTSAQVGTRSCPRGNSARAKQAS